MDEKYQDIKMYAENEDVSLADIMVPSPEEKKVHKNKKHRKAFRKMIETLSGKRKDQDVSS